MNKVYKKNSLKRIEGVGEWLVALISFFWGVGLNFPYEWWYISYGLHLGDFLFIIYILFLLLSKQAGHIHSSLYRIRKYALITWVFATILLLSTLVNTYRYASVGGGLNDVFITLRSIYYIVMVVFVAAFVKKNGFKQILTAYLLGITIAGITTSYYSISVGSFVWGLPLFAKFPNVLGNMFGVGALLCSLLFLEGSFFLPIFLVFLFVVMSAFTFSKGAWLMVFLAVIACVIILFTIYYKVDHYKRFRLVFGLVLGLLILGYLGAKYEDDLWFLFNLKIGGGAESIEARYHLLSAGFEIMLQHPFIGVGYRNYGYAYNNIILSAQRYSTSEISGSNAHNIWTQVGAIGGIPAFLNYIILFLYPYPFLYKTLPFGLKTKRVYVAIVFLVFVLSGSVQLQIMTQPFYWFFTALVIGWSWRVEEAGQRAEKPLSTNDTARLNSHGFSMKKVGNGRMTRRLISS